nr:hypothetical protein CFP56_56885 [Quercus suber]
MGLDIPNLDGPTVTGLLRRRLFPLIMTDAATLHAVLLLAASQYGRRHGPRSHTIDLLQLRGMAIREINRALTDPARGTSDQIIVAVAEMATYEALFGSHETFKTHMTGLTRMVTLRGGLPALGLDGLIERILLWVDANVAHVHRSRLHFDKVAFPTRETHPRPDPRRQSICPKGIAFQSGAMCVFSFNPFLSVTTSFCAPVMSHDSIRSCRGRASIRATDPDDTPDNRFESSTSSDLHGSSVSSCH